MRTTNEDHNPLLDDMLRAVGDAGAEAARRVGPVVTGAVLALAAMLLLIGLIAIMRSGGSGGSPGAAVAAAGGSLVGDLIECPGDKQVKSSFETDGSGFSMVGKLASVDSDGGLLVKGPGRYVQMTADAAARGAKVTGGDVIRVEGKIDEGQVLKATEISLACDRPSATPTVRPSTTPGSSDSDQSAPSSTPQPTGENPTAAPTDRPEPSSEATLQPTRTPEVVETPGPPDDPTGTPAVTAAPEVEEATAP